MIGTSTSHLKNCEAPWSMLGWYLLTLRRKLETSWDFTLYSLSHQYIRVVKQSDRFALHFALTVVSSGSADFDGSEGQSAGVVVSNAGLFEAIKAGSMSVVNSVLDHGANVNAVEILAERGVS
jgi:hypothetical protein